MINTISKKFINYLNTKEANEFESESLIELLDAIATKNDLKYKEILDEL